MSAPVTIIVGAGNTPPTPVIDAPLSSHPSYLEVQLIAKDSGGMVTTTSVTIQPKTVSVTLQSSPTGRSLTESASR